MILDSKDFFDYLHKEWDKRIVGEVIPREIIFAVALGGSLCLNAQKTSNNLIVNSKSGTGKDHVTTQVMKIIPGYEEKWFKRTRISQTAFTYWHNSHFEPEWTWNGKIFYGEDMSYNVLNCEVFKVMSSGGSYSTIVKDQRALNIQINGKPSIIITTAKASLQDELLRRFGIIQLDESKEQDDLIIDYQSEEAMNGSSKEYNPEIMQELTELKPVKVVIPFADKISQVFKTMKANIIVRTNYNRFIDFIKYSAILYQQQRSYEGDNTILASPEDYDKAVDWYDYMFRNQQLLPITNEQQRLLQVIKELGSQATVKDIISEATFAGRTWIYTNLNLMTEKGFLTKERIADETGMSNKKLDVYTYKEKQGLKLPYYFDL